MEDYYMRIVPKPPSSPLLNVLSSSPWNVSLAHNVVYTATLTAVNCVGDSDSTTIRNIQISKFVDIHSTYERIPHLKNTKRLLQFMASSLLSSHFA